jgi:XTP/dITP diphosphohydrolase
MDRERVLIATHNQGKVTEFIELLGDLEVEWLTLQQAGISVEIPEDGTTLLENARLKAEGYARLAGLLTLADDTGLEIDALGGAPGIYPARYGGEHLTMSQRYELVLRQMAGTPTEQRAARFRCVIAIANPGGALAHAEGVFEGLIAESPAGDGGFGYDPIFYVPEQGMTVAQLPTGLKHRISHRGQAIQKIAPVLRELLSSK